MPGSLPGERRGGRQKGTPNKATVLRSQAQEQATIEALAHLTPEQIAVLTPRAVMQLAMVQLVKRGAWNDAAEVARGLAPYEHRRLSADVSQPPDPGALERMASDPDPERTDIGKP